MNKKLQTIKCLCGRTRHSLTAFIMMLVSLSLSAQVTVTIPVNNDNDNWQNFPYGCSDGYQRIQTLYTANEIGLSGNITSIGFYVNALLNPAASTPVVIKMKNTKNTQVTTSSYDQASAGATTVYSGNILNSQLSPNGWVTVTLNTPFTYAGYNLEVFVETNNGFSGEDWDAKQFRWSDVANTVTQCWSGWNSPPGPNDMGWLDAAHPNVRFTIATAPAMTYDTTVVEQVLSAAYPSVKNQQVLALKVHTQGLSSPLSATSFSLSTNGSSSGPGLIENAKLYFTGISDVFDTTAQFGSTVISPSGSFSFTGNTTLDAGINHFWLTYDLSSLASPGDSVDAECSQVAISMNNHTPGPVDPAGNIKVGLNYTFEAVSDQGFVTETFNTKPNQWQRGVPLTGPSAAFNGTNCWGTNLSGDISQNSDYALTTPAFVITAPDASVRFNQWYDFGYMYNSLDAYFEYDINNTGWVQLSYIDPSLKHTTNGNWDDMFYALGVNIGDTVRFRWRLTTYQWTDPAAGWYIDNFVMAGGSPFSQQYLTSNVHQVGGLAVPGQKKVPVISLVVEASGSENPLSVTGIDFNTSGTGTVSNIESARVYFTGTSRTFDTTQAFGAAVANPFGIFSVSGNQLLQAGYNHFWLVYDVSASALPEDSLDALCAQLTVASVVHTPAISDPDGNTSIGIVVDFDTASFQGFTTEAYNATPNQWQKGTPFSGPSAYSGNECWGTNLNGYYSNNADYALLTPPYVASSEAVNLSFRQWYDFRWTWAGINADFQYRVNNGFWSTVYSVDNGNNANSGGNWEEVFTQLLTNIGDTVQFRWLFRSSQWSSMADGWFIDNFTYSGLSEFNQIYKSSYAETHQGLTFGGAKNQPVLRISVETSGSQNQLDVTAFDFNTNGTATFGIIDSARVFYTGTSGTFNTDNQFGSTVATPSGPFTFSGIRALESGINYFWLVYDVNDAALVNDSLDAEFTQITIGSANYTPTQAAPAGNIPVARLYDFDTAALQSFSARSLNMNPNQWEKGTPNSGPYSAYSGSDCWATGLNNDVNTSSEYELLTPPFVAASTEIRASFMQWFDFFYTWSNIDASFEYRVNRSGWAPLYLIDNTIRSNSDYNWEEVTSGFSVNIGDTVELRWKFRTDQWSPNAAGWYIDNFAISGVDQIGQMYISSNTAAVYESTIPGARNQPVIHITADVIGTISPLDVSSFELATGNSVPGIIESARLFYTGTREVFDTLTPFGSAVTAPSGTFTITGSQLLESGTNHFWLTYMVAPTAAIGDSLDATCTQITVASLARTPLETDPEGTVPVAMLYDFDTSITQDFSVISYNSNGNQWEHGSPSSGPFAAFSGSNCWATNLSGDFNNSSDYALLTPPYIATSDIIHITYQQWFDFLYTYNDVTARFQYNVNNSGWFTLAEIDNYSVSNSGYDWKKVINSTMVNLGDTVQFRWHFTSTQWSTPSSGWYIDDFSVSGVRLFDQYYKDAYAEQLPGATYAGARSVPVLRVAVETPGSNNPLTVSNLSFATNGSGVAITEKARLFYTGTRNVFDTTEAFGTEVLSPSGFFSYTGSVTLESGINYFWLAYDVSGSALAGDSLDAEFTQITVSSLPQAPSVSSPAGNMPVGLLYDFDGVSDEDFTAASLVNGPVDWERGVPVYANGPSSTFSGTKCWGTVLSGEFSLGNESVLLTPPYLATRSDLAIGFKQWYEFIYTSWNKKAEFQYQVNNSGNWQLLTRIDLTSVSSSGNKWLNEEASLLVSPGDTVQFRWRLYTDQWDAAPGWYIDNFLIAGADPLDVFGPSISYTRIINTNLTSNRTLSSFAEITDLNGVDVSSGNKPRIFYKKSSEADAFNGNFPSVNGWKYAEATNNSSPFSFVIDYSLLTSAPVTGDTIQYFVAAQDMNTSVNVGANPAAGFEATSINAIISAPLNPESYIITAGPMSGNYNVGTGQTYTTITQAVSDINLRGVNGPVTLSLTNNSTVYNLANGETFPITFYPVIGASASNTITIKPAAGVNATISSNNASFKIQGADHIIIDGSNNGTNSRNLTLLSTGTTGIIWICANSMTDGAEHCTVKNCILSGDNTTKFGIYSGSNQFTSVNVGPLAPSSYNRFENNSIAKVLYGIYMGGISKGRPALNNRFTGNILGDATNAIGIRGIYSSFSTGDTISGNVVQNLNFNFNNTYTESGGIYLESCKQVLVSANKVTNFRSTIGDTYLNGIYVNGGEDGWNGPVLPTNNVIVNNFIGNGYSTSNQTYAIQGLNIQAGSYDKIYYNTVSLTGNLLRTSGRVTAFLSGDNNLQYEDIRNNIFYVDGSSTQTAEFYAHITYADYSFMNSVSDYNLMYCAASGSATAYLGEIYYSTQPNLASWRLSSGQDANSKSAVVSFASASDLHLSGLSIGDSLNLAGTPIPGFTTDIDGDTRNPLVPYIGADENTASPLPVELLEFNAAASGNDVMITWITASETNNKGFTLERSADNSEFSEVTFVKGRNGSNRNSYRYADVRAFDQASTLYYRLKQEDHNGRITYSRTIRVSRPNSPDTRVTVYPNPFVKDVYVQVNAGNASQEVTISLHDITGRVVVSGVHRVSGTDPVRVISDDQLQPGIYFLSVETGEKKEIHKLIKH